MVSVSDCVLDRTSQDLLIAYSVCAVVPGPFPAATMSGVSAPMNAVCIDDDVLSADAGLTERLA